MCPLRLLAAIYIDGNNTLLLFIIHEGERGDCLFICRFPQSWSRIHERTISLRFLGIILRVLRLEVSICNVYITNQFQTTFAGGSAVGRVTMISKVENSSDFYQNYVQEFVLWYRPLLILQVNKSIMHSTIFAFAFAFEAEIYTVCTLMSTIIICGQFVFAERY